MADRPPYPDVEVLLCDLLDDLASTGTQTPPTLQTSMPFIRVERIGGPDDGWIDSALVAIDVFEATRPGAYALAESVRQRLLSFPQVVAGVGTLDKAETATGPNEVPWSDDQSVRRFAASYRVLTRR